MVFLYLIKLCNIIHEREEELGVRDVKSMGILFSKVESTYLRGSTSSMVGLNDFN